MYLLPDARSTNLKYRRSLILNHCRTIQLLFRSNSSLSLSRLLSSTDPEHLLVADRYCFKLFNPFLLPRSCSYASIVFHSTSEHLSQFYHGYENRESFVPDLGSLRLIVDDLNTNNDIILLLRYCETIHRLYHVVLLSFASHLVSKCDYSQFVSKSGFVLCIHSHSYYTVSLT